MKYAIVPLTIVLGLTFCTTATAQDRLNVEATCSYYGDSATDDLWSFSADSDARSAVERVMNYTGLPQNFEVLRGNVDNAMAAIRGDARVIVYNQGFMERVKATTRTDWSAVSILAHEIGHHLAGHTLRKDGSRPKTELEADKFSGHVLHKMGAELEDAKAAMRAVAGDAGSATHPPKSARLVAIETGWFDARDQSPSGAGSGSGGASGGNDTSAGGGGQSIPPPDPNPVPQGPQLFAEAHFADGGVFFVLDNNQIMMNYMGMTYQVATREASNDPNYAWLYVIRTGDAQTEAMMNMFGMSGTTVYGVDHQGNIWGSNMWGQPATVGRVYYH